VRDARVSALTRRARALAVGLGVALALALAADAGAGAGAARAEPPLVALGRQLFFERGLSEPAGTSCASCHDPVHAFSGNNGSSSGVARGSRAGHFARRNTPSVLYLKYVPRFHYYQDEDALQPSAFGGFFWDGRADSIAELIKQPLTNPDEMNNHDARAVVRKLRARGYADRFRDVLGVPLEPATADSDAAVNALGRALEAFLTSPAMAPFTSKYDAYVRGRAVLAPAEARGLALFRDPDKGNCASCHLLTVTSPTPERSMFTDYGFDAVAVPRNRKLAANRRTAAFDLGLCERTDTHVPSRDDRWCASFRTPSLRNVAVRPAFMHNGAFTSLRDVVAFYATRAVDPMRWYKSKIKFDDVPAKFRGQVNVNSIPYNRRVGDVAALDDQDIDALVAFLGTLTDAGYR
jgi:cytochrome c peroxidase